MMGKGCQAVWRPESCPSPPPVWLDQGGGTGGTPLSLTLWHCAQLLWIPAIQAILTRAAAISICWWFGRVRTMRAGHLLGPPHGSLQPPPPSPWGSTGVAQPTQLLSHTQLEADKWAGRQLAWFCSFGLLGCEGSLGN